MTFLKNQSLMKSALNQIAMSEGQPDYSDISESDVDDDDTTLRTRMKSLLGLHCHIIIIIIIVINKHRK